MVDNRECGHLGCGSPWCEPVCAGVPQYQYTVQTRGEFYEEAMQQMLFNDFCALAVSADGDGWNEPFSEDYTCDCTYWEGMQWVQTDPKCLDRPSLDLILAYWLQHVTESEYY